MEAAAKARRDQLTALGRGPRAADRRAAAGGCTRSRRPPARRRDDRAGRRHGRDRRPPRSPSPGRRARRRGRRFSSARRASSRRSSLRRSDSVMATRAEARPRMRFGAGRLDERHPAEHSGRLTRVAGLEQPPAFGEQTLDPLVVGRCHSICPRIEAATLSGKPLRAFQGLISTEVSGDLPAPASASARPAPVGEDAEGGGGEAGGGHEGGHRALVPRALGSGGLRRAGGAPPGGPARACAASRGPGSRPPRPTRRLRRPARPRAPRRGR